ncbi:MAG: ROK family glucokinase [Lachnospiraceae bacterium]
MGKYCLGVDIGGTTVKLGLFTVEGDLLERWEIVTRKENNGEKIISDIGASILEKLQERGIERTEVIGAGIGVPGPALENGDVPRCVNLGWYDKRPADELSAILGIPVKVGNDANIATLGEMWKGGGRGFKNVVMITLGTGVGGGVIIDGKMLTGNRGLAGELGHITVNMDETAVCNCGNRGCLEQYASATGIVRVAKRLMCAEGPVKTVRGAVKTFDVTKLLELEKEHGLTCKDVFDLAKNGDPLAKEATEILGRYLGKTLADMSLMIDPDVFVIGGGVSKAGDFLIRCIWYYYDKFLSISKKRAEIHLAELGNDAGIYGGVKLMLD